MRPRSCAYNGPVVVVALPGLPSRNPVTGLVTEASYVLEAPAGSGPAAGGSASVPFDTTLVFNAGTTLKLQNASLFVQNQGSALQALGTASNPVVFTSYNDASDGATNNNPDTTPRRRRLGRHRLPQLRRRDLDPVAAVPGRWDPDRVQWRRGDLRRPGRDVHPQLRGRPVCRRCRAARVEHAL